MQKIFLIVQIVTNKILKRNLKEINKYEISKLKNESGYYIIYDKNLKPIYIGISKILKHRLQSYYQKDDYAVNRTKRELRRHSRKFQVFYTNIENAKYQEKKRKMDMRFNYL